MSEIDRKKLEKAMQEVYVVNILNAYFGKEEAENMVQAHIERSIKTVEQWKKGTNLT